MRLLRIVASSDSPPSPPILPFSFPCVRTQVVVDLLRNGASPDLSREDGWAPLHAAARFGHAGTATALINEGRADFRALTADHGSTALHVAAISGFDEVRARWLGGLWACLRASYHQLYRSVGGPAEKRKKRRRMPNTGVVRPAAVYHDTWEATGLAAPCARTLPTGADGAPGRRERPGVRRRRGLDATSLRLRRRPRQLRQRADRTGGGPGRHDAGGAEAGLAHRHGEFRAANRNRTETEPPAEVVLLCNEWFCLCV